MLAALALLALSADAATLTAQTNQLGATPKLLGYNAGHFYPGSNTREWRRYAGVTDPQHAPCCGATATGQNSRT